MYANPISLISVSLFSLFPLTVKPFTALTPATYRQPDTGQTRHTRCQREEQRRRDGEAAFKQTISGGRIRQRLGYELWAICATGE